MAGPVVGMGHASIGYLERPAVASDRCDRRRIRRRRKCTRCGRTSCSEHETLSILARSPYSFGVSKSAFQCVHSSIQRWKAPRFGPSQTVPEYIFPYRLDTHIPRYRPLYQVLIEHMARPLHRISPPLGSSAYVISILKERFPSISCHSPPRATGSTNLSHGTTHNDPDPGGSDKRIPDA